MSYFEALKAWQSHLGWTHGYFEKVAVIFNEAHKMLFQNLQRLCWRQIYVFFQCANSRQHLKTILNMNHGT